MTARLGYWRVPYLAGDARCARPNGDACGDAAAAAAEAGGGTAADTLLYDATDDALRLAIADGTETRCVCAPIFLKCFNQAHIFS